MYCYSVTRCPVCTATQCYVVLYVLLLSGTLSCMYCYSVLCCPVCTATQCHVVLHVLLLSVMLSCMSCYSVSCMSPAVSPPKTPAEPSTLSSSIEVLETEMTLDESAVNAALMSELVHDRIAAFQPGQTGPGLTFQPGQTGPGLTFQPGHTGPGVTFQPGQTGPGVTFQPGHTNPGITFLFVDSTNYDTC